MAFKLIDFDKNGLEFWTRFTLISKAYQFDKKHLLL